MGLDELTSLETTQTSHAQEREKDSRRRPDAFLFLPSLPAKHSFPSSWHGCMAAWLAERGRFFFFGVETPKVGKSSETRCSRRLQLDAMIGLWLINCLGPIHSELWICCRARVCRVPRCVSCSSIAAKKRQCSTFIRRRSFWSSSLSVPSRTNLTPGVQSSPLFLHERERETLRRAFCKLILAEQSWSTEHHRSPLVIVLPLFNWNTARATLQSLVRVGFYHERSTSSRTNR